MKNIILIALIFLFYSCITAGLSVISSYKIDGIDKIKLRKSFDKLWEDYPVVRLGILERKFIYQDDDPMFNSYKKQYDSTSFINNPRIFYPVITKLTNNSVNYKFYFLKSTDGEIIYIVWIGEYDYSLKNCIDLKNSITIGCGYTNEDKCLTKIYRKKFENDIKIKLDSIIQQDNSHH